MHNALTAARLLADAGARGAALAAVADILEHLARWDTRDPGELADADDATCAAWALQAGTLVAAAGTGFAGPLLDAAVELRAAASRPPAIAAGVNPHVAPWPTT